MIMRLPRSVFPDLAGRALAQLLPLGMFSRCRMCRIDATVRQVVPVFTASFAVKELELFDFSGQRGV
jgi:hypothetical protein